MGIAETRARQLMDKIGIKPKGNNIYVSSLNDYAAIHTFFNGTYIAVAFYGNEVDIAHTNDYDLKDIILSFNWEGELSYHEKTVVERIIKM